MEGRGSGGVATGGRSRGRGMEGKGVMYGSVGWTRVRRIVVWCVLGEGDGGKVRCGRERMCADVGWGVGMCGETGEWSRGGAEAVYKDVMAQRGREVNVAKSQRGSVRGGRGEAGLSVRPTEPQRSSPLSGFAEPSGRRRSRQSRQNRRRKLPSPTPPEVSSRHTPPRFR